jgi:hypothetical protein
MHRADKVSKLAWKSEQACMEKVSKLVQVKSEQACIGQKNTWPVPRALRSRPLSPGARQQPLVSASQHGTGQTDRTREGQTSPYAVKGEFVTYITSLRATHPSTLHPCTQAGMHDDARTARASKRKPSSVRAHDNISSHFPLTQRAHTSTPHPQAALSLALADFHLVYRCHPHMIDHRKLRVHRPHVPPSALFPIATPIQFVPKYPLICLPVQTEDKDLYVSQTPRYFGRKSGNTCTLWESVPMFWALLLRKLKMWTVENGVFFLWRDLLGEDRGKGNVGSAGVGTE